MYCQSLAITRALCLLQDDRGSILSYTYEELAVSTHWLMSRKEVILDFSTFLHNLLLASKTQSCRRGPSLWVKICRDKL